MIFLFDQKPSTVVLFFSVTYLVAPSLLLSKRSHSFSIIRIRFLHAWRPVLTHV